MKGLSKKEASAWSSLRMTGESKKTFCAPSGKPAVRCKKKVVRFANGVQLTLHSNNGV